MRNIQRVHNEINIKILKRLKRVNEKHCVIHKYIQVKRLLWTASRNAGWHASEYTKQNELRLTSLRATMNTRRQHKQLAISIFLLVVDNDEQLTSPLVVVHSRPPPRRSRRLRRQQRSSRSADELFYVEQDSLVLQVSTQQQRIVLLIDNQHATERIDYQIFWNVRQFSTAVGARHVTLGVHFAHSAATERLSGVTHDEHVARFDGVRRSHERRQPNRLQQIAADDVVDAERVDLVPVVRRSDEQATTSQRHRPHAALVARKLAGAHTVCWRYVHSPDVAAVAGNEQLHRFVARRQVHYRVHRHLVDVELCELFVRAPPVEDEQRVEIVDGEYLVVAVGHAENTTSGHSNGVQ